MVGMRNLLTLSVALLMTGPVLAKGKRATAHHDTRLTYVDDEPMSKQAAHANAQSNDSGTLRAIEMRSAGPADVPRAAVGAPEQERGAGSDPMARTVKPVSGALEELAHRQMRRHQKSIDTCTQASKGSGTITLHVVVGERTVAKAEIADDQVHDAQLAQCLVGAAQKWTFSLSNASFDWTVAARTQASKLSQR
jgi:hypothetical protein